MAAIYKLLWSEYTLHMDTETLLKQSPLGKSVTYCGDYQPALLFALPRSLKRECLGIHGETPPFYGFDLWNAYEFSWLNPKGKPIAAIAQFLIPCGSPQLIESKAFKLYLNSFHQTQFNSLEEVSARLEHDLSACAQAPVMLEVAPLSTIQGCDLGRPAGICLDNLDISIDQYTVDPTLLTIADATVVTESLYTDIFKSNCLGTRQPDWGTIRIEYTGPQLNHAQLLKYLISYRQHNEFGEHCVERIFIDIMQYCQPQALTVTGHFTRRGGLDINPCRSTDPQVPVNSTRFFRQ